jgi:hypothetical protein
MFQRMYPIMRAAAVLIYRSPPRGFGGTGEMGNTTFGGVGDGPEPEVESGGGGDGEMVDMAG